jgi:hypothetical protein
MEPISALIGLGSSLIGGITQAIGAGSARKRAASDMQRYDLKLKGLEASRQQIIDPYAAITDLSSMISNPFANIQVATKQAEMQAAETDISLASTLDVLRETGAGAGGATALAQAAARSKQGIAASIEQQEAENSRLRAQGEAQMQQMRLQEMSRVQQARAAGQQFMFGARETRETQQLERAQTQLDQATQQEAAYRQQQMAGLGSAIGSLGAIGGLAAGGAFGKGDNGIFSGIFNNN